VHQPPTSIADLARPAYKGMVALDGDPTKAGAAFAAVYAAALAKGGSFSDIGPGIQFFAALKKSGNFIPVSATPATIESGQTPITLDWDYVQVATAKSLAGKVDWKAVIPSDALYGNYYDDAVNKDAPHPAAARLWEEFIYSNEGQNLFLQGSARPVRLPAMEQAGSVDQAALAALPAADGTPAVPTPAQVDAAKQEIGDDWAETVG
jgi:putative spermidine/putrescine transport system substrate-binding protein